MANNIWYGTSSGWDAYRYEPLSPVTMVNDGPMLVVVNNQSPISSFKDLIAAARVKPGQITYGSPGSGAVNHLATEWLATAAGIKLLHVPYKGAAIAVTAVVQGERFAAATATQRRRCSTTLHTGRARPCRSGAPLRHV